MTRKPQIFEITVSQLDWYVINKAKELRIRKGISQSQLAVDMGFSEKLIGSIENPSLPARFNIRHLNLLAQALGCSLWELIPEKPLDNDLVRIRIKKSERIGKNGKPTSKSEFEVLDIKALKRK